VAQTAGSPAVQTHPKLVCLASFSEERTTALRLPSCRRTPGTPSRHPRWPESGRIGRTGSIRGAGCPCRRTSGRVACGRAEPPWRSGLGEMARSHRLTQRSYLIGADSRPLSTGLGCPASWPWTPPSCQ
jgi:hypothetical protein